MTIALEIHPYVMWSWTAVAAVGVLALVFLVVAVIGMDTGAGDTFGPLAFALGYLFVFLAAVSVLLTIGQLLFWDGS